MPAVERAPILRAFGNAIREVRLERGLSQEGLAELSGLHRTYVGAVERGQRNVSLANIARIARALDLEISAMFQEAERLLARNGGR